MKNRTRIAAPLTLIALAMTPVAAQAATYPAPQSPAGPATVASAPAGAQDAMKRVLFGAAGVTYGASTQDAMKRVLFGAAG